MTTTATTAERSATSERKEPTYLFTEKYVADKSEIARRFIETGHGSMATSTSARRRLSWCKRSPVRSQTRISSVLAKTKAVHRLVVSAWSLRSRRLVDFLTKRALHRQEVSSLALSTLPLSRARVSMNRRAISLLSATYFSVNR